LLFFILYVTNGPINKVSYLNDYEIYQNKFQKRKLTMKKNALRENKFEYVIIKSKK